VGSAWNIKGVLLRNHSHCPSAKRGTSFHTSLQNSPTLTRNNADKAHRPATWGRDVPEGGKGERQGRVPPATSPSPSQAESTAHESCEPQGSARGEAICKFGRASLSFQKGIEREVRVYCVFISCSEPKGSSNAALPLHVSHFQEPQSWAISSAFAFYLRSLHGSYENAAIHICRKHISLSVSKGKLSLPDKDNLGPSLC